MKTALPYLLLAGGIGITGIFVASRAPQEQPEAVVYDSLQEQVLETQGVRVAIIPFADEETGQLIVDVQMNTHTTELDTDMLKQSFLRTDQGERLAPRSWEGDPPGGHHRSGKLFFPLPQSSATIIIQGIGDSERDLEFSITL